MDQQVVDELLVEVSDTRYAQLYELALGQVQRLVTELAEESAVTVADPGAKPGDLAEEARRRLTALREVRAGHLAGALLAEVVAADTADRASTAVWLGASLADLGSTSGTTRQAVRKRWPDLGQIYRTRRWLGGHREDILAIVDMLLAEASQLGAAGAVAALRLARQQALDPDGSWQRLAELVNNQVRRLVALATPRGQDAERAISGAIGLLAYYDTVTAEPA